MHLGPPGVVGVVDDEKDLTPEQDQRWVCSDELKHQAVQTLQSIKITPLPSLSLQQPAARCRDPTEHSWKVDSKWELGEKSAELVNSQCLVLTP